MLRCREIESIKSTNSNKKIQRREGEEEWEYFLVSSISLSLTHHIHIAQRSQRKFFLHFSWCSCCAHRRRFTFDFFLPCFCSLACCCCCCCNRWAFYSSHSSPISSRRSQKKRIFLLSFHACSVLADASLVIIFFLLFLPILSSVASSTSDRPFLFGSFLFMMLNNFYVDHKCLK